MDRKKFKKKRTLIQQWKNRLGRMFYVCVGGLAILYFYLGGLLAQMTAISFSEDSHEISFGLFGAIWANTKSLRGLAILTVLIIAFVFWLYYRDHDLNSRDLMDDERGFQTDGSGEFGVNRIMQTDEARDYFEIEPLNVCQKRGGFIIGREIIPETRKLDRQAKADIVYIPEDGQRIKRSADGRRMLKRVEDEITHRMEKQFMLERMTGYVNGHVMIMGPSGSGKTYCVALTNIFNYIKLGHSIYVTDPKGELYAITSKYAESMGYTVKILNLYMPQYSDSWDVLGEAERNADMLEVELGNICQLIIDNTSGTSGEDEAYRSGQQSLLLALVYFIMYEMPRDKRQLGTVMELLEYDDDTLNGLFENCVHDLPKRPWRTYYGGSPNFRGNLKAGLANRMNTLNYDTIRNMTGVPDIDLTLPGKTKCIYYVIMEDMSSTFKFISSLFFTSSINALVAQSRRNKSRALDIPVHFILDEFAAIGVLPDFDKKLAMVRSAKISMVIIFQTLAQLEKLYPEKSWETLIANCGTIMCLKCADLTAAEYLSKRSGESTINVEQTRMQRPIFDRFFAPSSQQVSEGLNKRAVMTTGEVLTLAEDEILVFAAGSDVYFVKKMPWKDLMDENLIEEVSMTEHSPLWRDKLSGEATRATNVKEDVYVKSYAETREERYGSRHKATEESSKEPIDERRQVKSQRTEEEVLGAISKAIRKTTNSEHFDNNEDARPISESSECDSYSSSADDLFDKLDSSSESDESSDDDSYDDAKNKKGSKNTHTATERARLLAEDF